MPVDRDKLHEPFGKDRLKQRPGSGGRPLDYVQFADVIYRVLEATNSEFDWIVTKLEYIVSEKPYWLCCGTLSIPGLGTRSGVGTAVARDEDSVKSAETDAYKRAAVKFGVALDLYFKEGGPPAPTARNFAQEFKERAQRMGYEGKMSPLCAALEGKALGTLATVDYAEALKKSAAEWNRAIGGLKEPAG